MGRRRRLAKTGCILFCGMRGQIGVVRSQATDAGRGERSGVKIGQKGFETVIRAYAQRAMKRRMTIGVRYIGTW